MKKDTYKFTVAIEVPKKSIRDSIRVLMRVIKGPGGKKPEDYGKFSKFLEEGDTEALKDKANKFLWRFSKYSDKTYLELTSLKTGSGYYGAGRVVMLLQRAFPKEFEYDVFLTFSKECKCIEELFPMHSGGVICFVRGRVIMEIDATTIINGISAGAALVEQLRRSTKASAATPPEPSVVN